MTETTLEKVARALYDADITEMTRGPVVYDCAFGPWESHPPHARQKHYTAARAALLAIREPDGGMIAAGMAAEAPGQGTMESILEYDNRGEESLAASFTAMIDAILAEKPEAPTT